MRFVCDADYANVCKRKIKTTVKGDGIVNSVGYLHVHLTVYFKFRGIRFTEYDFISRYVTLIMSYPCFTVFYPFMTVSLCNFGSY